MDGISALALSTAARNLLAEQQDVLLTRVEAARYLRVSVPTLERWARLWPATKIGPEPLRVGHGIRYRLSDVRAAPQVAVAA
jgi:hypothetical protein